MGLNVSNNHIAQELDLCSSDAHYMTTVLRNGVVGKPEVILDGEVEFDVVYIVAGHKGHPEALKNLDRPPRKRRLKGAPGRGTLEKDKPPVLGMIQRGGQVIINMLSNVKKVTIEPFIKKHVAPQSQVYTDEYNIYDDLESWGFRHKTVCHGKGEYARDDDTDGIYEVHVNTIEGFWSLLRSWLRPHRGISQEALPLYLGFLSFCIMLAKEAKACFSLW